ncbi:MAG TPA: ATPase, T2SS/T4P/T4SS family [Pseudomonadales bacterium]|nr:ATPase, T2SS/T4P/T4SS family [Pseudomonadales bacterium]
MNNTAKARPPERLLDLRNTLDELVADGLLDKRDANFLAGSPRSRENALLHPLAFIAKSNLQDQLRPGKLLDEERLTNWMAEKSGQPYYNIDPLKIDVSKTTAVMSFAFAKRHQILCVQAGKDEILVASTQPWIYSWETDLKHTAKREIRRVVVKPSDLARFTVEFYSLAKSVSDASDMDYGNNIGIGNFEQLLKLSELKDPEANDQHIVNIVDWMLQYAFAQRASDIHIEPRREVGNVRFRIDGVLHQVYELPARVMIAVTSRLKILGRMNIAEKRKPQDGRIKTQKPDGSEVELRMSTLPTAFGEKLVMRIFDPEILVKTFPELGLIGDDLKRWTSLINQPNGILLVTGPTGSGKTTTLYSSLKQIATPDVNVSTIEDPIEMVEEAFNQMQVNRSIDLDFATGVRTLMRQDPDIIMIGEIRDQETADMAVQAAMTGHLVLSTLHTNDAPSTISRLLDLGVPAYLLRSSLLGVMAQRLVRRLCVHCKEETTITEDAWKSLTTPWKVATPARGYKPVGCLECRNTGYRGREGIYEILQFTDSVKELISDKTDLVQVRQLAMRDGMRTLRLSGAQKVAAGLTTIEEVMRVAPALDRFT